MSRRVSELTQQAVAFAAAREWSAFHDPKNLVMAISSEVGELCSLLRWVGTESADAAVAEPQLRVQIAHEIGDVAILLLLLCNRLGVELDELIVQKLAINEVRYPVSESRGRAERPEVSE